jgi:hypothetical protein
MSDWMSCGYDIMIIEMIIVMGSHDESERIKSSKRISSWLFGRLFGKFGDMWYR